MIGISAMLDPLLPTVVATAALAIQTAVPVKSRVSFCEASAAWPRSFAEEFDGPDLNSSRWSKYLHNSAGQCGFGIGRFGRCDADNVYIEDGKLVLKSDKLPAQQCTAKEGCFNYTSAGVTSRDKATWSVAGGAGYRVCVSAMLPGGTSADDGAGIWPAHWMMPNDSNSEQGTQACTGPRKNGGCSCDPDEGEIDILEMVDGNAQACGTYHWQTTWPAKNCSYPVGHKSVHECTALPVDWGSTFHEFAVEHTQDYLAFVVDNKVLVNVSKDDTQAPLFWDMPFFLILNTAIGGSGTWAKPPNSNTYWPTYHRIDYVRGSVRSSG